MTNIKMDVRDYLGMNDGYDKDIIDLIQDPVVEIEAEHHVQEASYLMPRNNMVEKYSNQLWEVYSDALEDYNEICYDMLVDWGDEEIDTFIKTGETLNDTLETAMEQEPEKIKKMLTYSSLEEYHSSDDYKNDDEWFWDIEESIKQGFVAYDVDTTYSFMSEFIEKADEVYQETADYLNDKEEEMAEKIFDIEEDFDYQRGYEIASSLVLNKKIQLTPEEEILAAKVLLAA